MTILLADNDIEFLKTQREILEAEGYSVIPAASLLEAKRILKARQVSLLILDIRLIDDDDEKDVSGLILAKEIGRAVPKIILTRFPTYEAVRDALGPTVDGLSSADNFIAKQEGADALLLAVRKVMASEHINTRRDVFIVHGHDEAAREAVARFIEKLGLRPIILREQPGKGSAIIEQIEHYSEVGFVVVLFTGDDVGYPKDSAREKRPRARQNVIFELGFFVGKLGRARVCSLYKEGVEILSDYQGVLYIPLDPSEGWKLKLAQEIREAGISVDLSKIT